MLESSGVNEPLANNDYMMVSGDRPITGYAGAGEFSHQEQGEALLMRV